jgi:NADH-quinone oxidoreductase subunit J
MVLIVAAGVAALLVLSGIGLVALGLIEAAETSAGAVLFGVLSILLITASLGVVLERSPIRSALSLVLALFLLAVMFVTLDAPLIAALQIIVYAGAIMVLFLFVIMLLNLQETPREMARLGSVTAAVLGGSLFLLAVVRFFLSRPVAEVGAALPGPGMASPVSADFGSIEMLGERLFTHFILAFEVTSLLLLVAAVGALVLAKRTWV